MRNKTPLARSRTFAMTAMRSVSILGATGSIGSSTIDLLRKEYEGREADIRVEFAQRLKTDYDKYEKIIRATGAQAQ